MRIGECQSRALAVSGGLAFLLSASNLRFSWRSSVTYTWHIQTRSSRDAKPDSVLAHHQQVQNTWFTLAADMAPF